MTFTGAEHLAESKKRALYRLASGRPALAAVTTLLADLRSHPETRNHEAVAIAIRLQELGKLRSPESVRTYIERFVK